MNPRRNIQRHRLNQKRHKRWFDAIPKVTARWITNEVMSALNNTLIKFHPKAFEMVWAPDIRTYPNIVRRMDVLYGLGTVRSLEVVKPIIE
jgi:hypothetical protein